MSCGLPCRDYSAGFFAIQQDDHEQDLPVSHADDLNPFLAVFELCVDFFQPIRVFKGRNGVREIYAVLAMILGSFGIVPFILPHPKDYRISVVAATAALVNPPMADPERDRPYAKRSPW
jgi:hypothetical protein